MSYLLECVIGTLAAVGFICILKAIYDIIMASYAHTEQPATLFLSGDGNSPASEHLLLAAEQARRLYLPGMEIVFLELGETQDNPAARLAARRGITYIK